MTQASQKIMQQYIDGGVIPARLEGQAAVSKTYVDGQLAIRDTNISAAKNAANIAQASVDNHKASTTAHPAQNITYSGQANGSTVKQAIDGLDARIDNLILAPGDSGPEVKDARGKYPVLGARLDATASQLADIAYNVKNYDTVALAVADASLIGGTLLLPPGTYSITTNLTIPGNVTLLFSNGAKLSIALGVTVTINGGISAGEHQIFNGDGTVNGSPLNTVIEGAWFGVPTNNNVDASPTLQKVLTYCQQAERILTLSPKSKLRLDTQVVIEHGKNAELDQRKELVFLGNNSSIFPNFNGAAFYIKPLCEKANASAGHGVAYIKIQDISFDGYFSNVNGHTSAYALQIGRAGYVVDSFTHSEFRNLLSINFQRPAYQITTSRMLEFDNVIGRSCGIRIETAGESSEFCGDITFNDCQFQGSSTNKPLQIYSYTPIGNVKNEVRGLRFNSCVFFGGGTTIESSTSSLVGDIWFNDCAWDYSTVVGDQAVFIFANGNAAISNVIFDSPYIVNYLGEAIKVQTDGDAKISHFKITGGMISLITASVAAVDLISCEHAMIQDCSFTAINSEAAIRASSSNHISIQGNSLQSSTGNSFVKIDTTTDFIVTNNIGTKPINDLTGTVNKLVANNLVTTS